MPLLLDLFCGAGGAAMGYHRAGFDVIGMDIEPQPNYPFTFIRANVLEDWIELSEVDAVHASPPCQDHIRGGLQRDHGTGWMLEETRAMLLEWGKPAVIENVPGAPMRPDVMLCGSQFGLRVRRHRWFERIGWNVSELLPPCDHSRPVTGVYGHPHGDKGAWPGMLPSTIAVWRQEMGIDWMTAGEIVEAIPPAYTEYIGRQLLEHLAESQITVRTS